MRLNILQENFSAPSAQTSNDTQWNIGKTVEKISELTELDDNWDSYGALAPTKNSCIGSVQLAYELLKERTPIPDVFPVPNGNIQFEWSNFGLDIEIEIESNRKCIVSFEDLETGENWNSEFSFDLSDLSQIIDDLTNRSLSESQLQIVS